MLQHSNYTFQIVRSMPKLLKIGSKVKMISFGDFEGVVEKIMLHNPDNPVEEHGMIEIRITKLGKKDKYLAVGDLEHVVHYQWNYHMEVIG